MPGSVHTYLTRLAEPLNGSIRHNTRVSRVSRKESSVVVAFNKDESAQFDEVVFAITAERALALIDSPHREETEVLSRFRSAEHDIGLSKGQHPNDRRRKSSSLYVQLNNQNKTPASGFQKWSSVTIDGLRMRIQDLLLHLLVPEGTSPPVNTMFRWKSTTPCLYPKVLQSQQQHSTVSGKDRVHYCGACWGNGLHEAAIQSALAVARHFDLGLEAI